MSTIMYTPFHLKNIQVSNRLVASAMFEYGADNGKITEKIKERYLALARRRIWSDYYRNARGKCIWFCCPDYGQYRI